MKSAFEAHLESLRGLLSNAFDCAPMAHIGASMLEIFMAP